jgi:hypothetical protein
MVFFRRKRDNEHVILAKDKYDPLFAMETYKVSPKYLAIFIESVLEENWDLSFLIMMVECPEEVKVDMELREDTLESIYGYDHIPTQDDLLTEIQTKHPNKNSYTL